jgi:hypothetical protein
VCTSEVVQRVNRRKSSTAILLDRRKSFVDVIERVLGGGWLPESVAAPVHGKRISTERSPSKTSPGPKMIVLSRTAHWLAVERN